MFHSKHDAENRSLSDIEEGREEHEEKKKRDKGGPGSIKKDI